MPRRLQILLTLALFTAAMLALGWVLKSAGRPAYDWVWDTAGGGVVWAALIVLVLGAAIVGFWPRNPDGSMRRLPRRG